MEKSTFKKIECLIKFLRELFKPAISRAMKNDD